MGDKLTHFMTAVKVGPKGQIVIPKEIRDMFGIEPGDSLVVMADHQRGIAVHKQSVMEGIAKAIFNGQGGSIYPRESAQDLNCLAEAIENTVKHGEDKK